MDEQYDTTDRWTLLRDVMVFQGKLLIDAMRDVMLSPVSLIAALLDVLETGDRAGQNFYQVILFGRKTERWISLFSAAGHLDEEQYRDGDPQGVDVLVERLEGVVMQEYERGGITTKTKDVVDYALDNLLLKYRKPKDGDSPETDGKE
ncbi:MAG: hypothetical protein V3T39_00120 [Gammaproteobacteria bacterium]